jgi:cysteine desulfurase
MQNIYLDNAATTPIDSDVISVITETMQTTFGNPSSTHQFGRSAKALVEKARKDIAKHFKAQASEIIFTAGGSEADNLILINAVVNLGVKRIISSKIEHHAVTHTLEYLKNNYNTTIDFVDLNKLGEIDYAHLQSILELNSDKTIVSLMYVNNELGTLLNLKKVSQLCQDNKALFHSDTVQGVGHFEIDVQDIAIDFMTASAHKFHGSKGVGFAYIRKGFGIQPMLLGGEQERGARAGTENVPNIVGMALALEKAYMNLESETSYIQDLKQYFIAALKVNFKDIQFNGVSSDLNKSSYIILNVRFPKDIPMLLFSLDLKGIAVSGGSACQSGSHKGSHVLNAILSDSDASKTSVRFSFSKYNSKEELDYVIGVLKEIIV